MNIATADIVFSVIIIFMAIRVAVKGFVAEFLSFAAVIVGIGGAVLFSNSLSKVIEKFFGVSFWNPVIAFLVIFLVVYFIIKLFESAISGALESINLDRLDRAIGFLLGLAEGFVIVILIVFIMKSQTFVDVGSMLDDSLYVKFLLPVIPLLKGAILDNR